MIFLGSRIVMKKHKYATINEAYYTQVIDIRPTQYIRLKADHRFFYNEFHKMFVTLNLADIFTIRKGHQLQKEIEKETELVTLEKITAGK